MPLRAADLMTANPITIAPETSVLDVQHLFVQANIGGAPVVDSSGVVRGVITSTDLLRVMDQVCDEDLDPGESDDVDGLTAIDVATPSPIWVAPDAPLSEVARVMRHEGIHRVLVGSGGQLAGVLTSFDLLAAVH